MKDVTKNSKTQGCLAAALDKLLLSLMELEENECLNLQLGGKEFIMQPFEQNTERNRSSTPTRAASLFF